MSAFPTWDSLVGWFRRQPRPPKGLWGNMAWSFAVSCACTLPEPYILGVKGLVHNYWKVMSSDEAWSYAFECLGQVWIILLFIGAVSWPSIIQGQRTPESSRKTFIRSLCWAWIPAIFIGMFTMGYLTALTVPTFALPVILASSFAFPSYEYRLVELVAGLGAATILANILRP